jgi:hypothetical protein
VVRGWILSAAVIGLATAVSGASFAQAMETCQFQVKNRSKVGYRGMSTYWVKGQWMREEKRTGGGLELILVSNEKGLYIKNKHTKYWFRYPTGIGAQLRKRILGGPIGDLKRFLKSVHAVNVGKEKVEGERCNIWTYRFKESDDKFRLWTDLKNSKPIRMERDYRVPGTKKRDTLVVEYKNYVANRPLPDSLFQIGKKDKVVELKKETLERIRKEVATRQEPKPGTLVPPKTATPEAPKSGTPEAPKSGTPGATKP